MFDEYNTVEKPIIEFLVEKLGYRVLSAADFRVVRNETSERIVETLFVENIMNINNCDKQTAERIYTQVSAINSNETFFEILYNGVDIQNKKGQIEKIKIIDFDNMQNNDFLVTNQVVFAGINANIRADIVIYINGMPVVLIEAKSEVKGQDYTNGIDQIKRYENDVPEYFLTNGFNISIDIGKAVYGTFNMKKSFYKSWHDVELEGKYDNDKRLVTVESLLEKEKLLSLLRHFIFFENFEGKSNKIIARYHQYNAINKIVNRVADGKEKKGLIWHTQGSGKSKTMIFTAMMLRTVEKLRNPKVFVVVDRIDLNDQIKDDFISSGAKNVKNIDSKEELLSQIKSDERGIFITTIQKAADLPNRILNESNDIVVLIDEAHREYSGKAAIKLKKAMNNGFYFGFTGTPILKKNERDKKKDTFFEFSPSEKERYLDKYSINDSIRDGILLLFCCFFLQSFQRK